MTIQILKEPNTSIRLQCRRCWQVFNWSKNSDRYSSICSLDGIGSKSRRSIRSGAKSILPRLFLAGPASVQHKRVTANHADVPRSTSHERAQK